MNPTPDQPLSRRAARAARRATGEQPTVDAAAEALEETGSTGGQVVTGPDGQPLTRRRLRELRATGMIPTVTPESTPVVEPSPVVTPSPSRAPEPSTRTTAPQPELRDTAPQPAAPQSAFAPKPEPGSAAETPRWTAPEGHWTRQLEVEDEVEMTASREVGSSSTASTLVVEEMPKVVDLGGPLGETGKVLLTGSITLSPDFAATGAISGVHGDNELDEPYDSAHPTTGAAPVRASAVASQHALGTPIIAGGKPRAARAINVLIVTAAVLAVLVTGLFVTAVVLRWI